VAFSSDDTRIVIASWVDTAKAEDAEKGTTLFDLNGLTENVTNVSFGLNGT
jgi:hypothetical protein